MPSAEPDKLIFDNELLALLSTEDANRVVRRTSLEVEILFATAGFVRENGIPWLTQSPLRNGRVLKQDVYFRDPALGHRLILRTSLMLYSDKATPGRCNIWMRALIPVPVPTPGTKVPELRHITSKLIYSAAGEPAPTPLDVVVASTKTRWLSFLSSFEGVQGAAFRARGALLLKQYSHKTSP